MRRHHQTNVILPDPYEDPMVPKNRGLVLENQFCSLGGTQQSTAAGITPGNYMQWLPDRSFRGVTDGFWAGWSLGFYPITAFNQFGTIETDEIAWFDRNLTYHVGLNTNLEYNHYFTTDVLKLDRFFGIEDVPNINDYLQTYGGLFPWGDSQIRSAFYPTYIRNDGNTTHDGNIGFKVYDISEGNTQPSYNPNNEYEILNWDALNDVTGGEADYGTNKVGVWKVPETDVILQLLGQLPRHHEIAGTGTRFDDVMDFFLINESADPIKRIPDPIAEAWYHENISGLGFLPNGKIQSGASISETQMNNDHFGVAAFFATFQRNGAIGKSAISLAPSRNQTDTAGGQVVPQNFVGIAIGSNWSAPGHNAGLRYCRIKTVAERGYKLIADTDRDRVFVVDPDDERTDLPIGIERGVALRYMNRTQRVVTQRWSVIQAEAAELLAQATIEV